MALTENTYVGNGSTVLYPFTFPYIDETDVKVSLNQLDTTAFTLANATTVELDSAPTSGVSIRIYRVTPTDSISNTFFPGSAIRAQDLNDNFEQTLYVVQENQTIIENSDAASVVGIANQALATAGQAKNTADAVDGKADQALTASGEAETTANQALLDAATAQSSALAARTIADAALNPGSVISDLSNVSAAAPATEQVLAWSGSQWRPVDQTGTGGSGVGTDAWVLSDASANILNSFNIASVSSLGSGSYRCNFITPMPSAQYAVQVTPAVGSNDYTAFANTRATDHFTIQTTLSGVATNSGFSATVNATNATLPSTFTIAQFNDLVARVTALENP